jgi:hypothetical protein
MRKVASVVALVSALLFLLLVVFLFVDLAKANGIIPEYKYLPEITINRDGIVTLKPTSYAELGTFML